MKKFILFTGIIAVFILLSCNKKVDSYRITNLTQDTIIIAFVEKDGTFYCPLSPQDYMISSGVKTKDLNFINTDIFTILYKDTLYFDSNPFVGGVLDKQAYRLDTQTEERDWYQFDITEEYILSLPKVEEN